MKGVEVVIKSLIKKNLLLVIICGVIIVAIAIFAMFLLFTQRSVDGESQNNRNQNREPPPELVSVAIANLTTNTNLYADTLYFPLGIAVTGESINRGSGVEVSEESAENTTNSYSITGELYIADTLNNRIQIVSGENLTNLTNIGGESAEHIDGAFAESRFNAPSDVVLASNGVLYVSDAGNNAIRLISILDETVLTVAGGMGAGFADGREGEAMFNNPQALVACRRTIGTIYVADTMNHIIRKIDADGNVTTIAGIPEQSGFADGASGEAMFFEPQGLFLSADGNSLYVADTANHAIRRVTISSGAVTTIAGMPSITGTNAEYTDGDFVDGEIIETRFNFPRAVEVVDNNIFVADTMNHAIRVISNGETRTILGNGTPEQFYASAENLRLAKPSAIAVVRGGVDVLFISDTLNNSVISVPLNESVMAGRLSKNEILSLALSQTLSENENDKIRIFADGKPLTLNGVLPWTFGERVLVPIKDLFSHYDGNVHLNQIDGTLSVEFSTIQTLLTENKDYFIENDEAVMPLDELKRLFPHSFEWFPEFNAIVVTRRLD
ncbi:MAG: hypothetical protein FWF76_03220 [Oscillospiraceae bacterium]|nr:hypothetical protein [Oscillospiraceae bacterium]